MKPAAARFADQTSLPVSTAILDPAGTILAVNDVWRDFGRRNAFRLANHGVGANYFKYCGSGREGSSDVAAKIRDLIDGRLDLLTLVYPCHSPSEKRWFVLIGAPLSADRPTAVALLHVDLSQMLVGPTAADAFRVGMGRATMAGSVFGSQDVGESVERAVAEALSSDLLAMFRGDRDSSSRAEAARPQKLDHLSKRQLQVFKLLGEGKSNVEIARQLFRSPNTVKLHVSAILKQLQLKSRTQAALLAARLSPADTDE